MRLNCLGTLLISRERPSSSARELKNHRRVSAFSITLTRSVRLREVKNVACREIAGTAAWCPLMGVVCLREVSVSGGSGLYS